MNLATFIGIWAIVGLICFLLINREEGGFTELGEMIACLLICVSFSPAMLFFAVYHSSETIASFLNKDIF